MSEAKQPNQPQSSSHSTLLIKIIGIFDIPRILEGLALATGEADQLTVRAVWLRSLTGRSSPAVSLRISVSPRAAQPALLKL